MFCKIILFGLIILVGSAVISVHRQLKKLFKKLNCKYFDVSENLWDQFDKIKELEGKLHTLNHRVIEVECLINALKTHIDKLLFTSNREKKQSNEAEEEEKEKQNEEKKPTFIKTGEKFRISTSLLNKNRRK